MKRRIRCYSARPGLVVDVRVLILTSTENIVKSLKSFHLGSIPNMASVSSGAGSGSSPDSSEALTKGHENVSEKGIPAKLSHKNINDSTLIVHSQAPDII